ncbi:group II intron reverse transcriptase/maturase [Ligilactobacillus acidipiscis]|uniref:group II intron reverse transcriptase/maturase n=1 Tax=Ligilactobacillus acidipiscis TaxID=89059 RepID=UPI000A243E52|nr:group II intron reverse transcriptase/maturase [Ligilactobacillus acidipiscis]
MRQSQKTENKADYLRRVTLEGSEQTGARSVVSGEKRTQNGLLREKVLDRNNLNRAFVHVKRNKGAGGIDGMTVEELGPYLKENNTKLVEELRSESYQPQPVKRVEIPKPDGSKRKLGIPTVVDRVVQQALQQQLSPIFEKVFSDNSYGFRPHRSAQSAVKKVVAYYNQGYHYVVDLDLKSYFDNVNHDLLIKFVENYISEPWVLHLIRKFLTSGVMNGQLFEESVKVTPQGGNISPLLANIYLNELDKELTRREHKFVRYADDCNIYVKSKRAGERVLKSITQFLEKELKVEVNAEKTQVGSPLRLKFLGFSLGAGRKGAYLRPHQKSKQRVKQELKRITRRNRGVSLDKILKEIKQKMQGWVQYYSIGKMSSFLRNLDAWLRSRIRQYIWKQWKNIGTRFKALVKLGMSHKQAKTYANTRKGYWRNAHSKTLLMTITNKRLTQRGLLNMSQLYQSIQSKA